MWKPRSLPGVPDVTHTAAQDRITSGALLIDVRERYEYEASRIAGSDFCPLSRIDGWWRDLPLDREIIVICNSGNRSAQLVRALRDQAGFDNVVNLAGGIVEWFRKGLPVESSME
jgi:rhodanese-related sulfurtransferase